MNQMHIDFLSSPDYAKLLETELVPWLEGEVELGDDVLEVGPGPGLTTDLIRTRTQRLTAVELDEELATGLAARLSGSNVDVVHADATAAGFDADRFSSATSFSMLHHIPTSQQQDQLFAEVCRVLRPGGSFIGTDSIDNEWIREWHVDDIFVPVDPDTFGLRLEAAGFTNVTLNVNEFGVRFVAQKPGTAAAR